MQLFSTASIKQYLIYIPIGVYLAVIPSIQYQANGIEGLFNVKRSYELLLFGWLTLAALFSRELRRNIVSILSTANIKTWLALLIIFIMGGISSSVSEFPDWAFLEVSHFLLMFAIIFIVAGSSINLENTFFILKIIVVSTVGFYILRFFIGYFLHFFSAYPLWPGRKTEIGLFGFAHRRFFNHIQTWALPLLFVFIWEERNSNIKNGLIFLAVLWSMLLIASAGRGSSLGVLGSLIIISLFLRMRGKDLYKYVFFTCVVSTGLYFLLFKILTPSSTQSLLREGSSGRINEWLSLIPGIISHPIMGFGPMHYASINLGNSWGHPHNWFIQFVYEWGLPTAIILLVAIVRGLFLFYKQIKVETEENPVFSKTEKIKIGFLWAMMAAFLHAFLSGIIVTPMSQVWMVLIVGISIAVYFENPVKKERETNFKMKEILLIVVLFFSWAGILNWFSKYDIDKYDTENSEISIELKKGEVIHPRYWQQGKIGR